MIVHPLHQSAASSLMMPRGWHLRYGRFYHTGAEGLLTHASVPLTALLASHRDFKNGGCYAIGQPRFMSMH